jgi:DNA invertase Pin-like site-specific DNA recombinase
LSTDPLLDRSTAVATIGYARVSTGHQTLDQQEDALNAHGVDKIFSDVMSGTRDDRPGLKALLDYCREGDVVTVVALDRLGRSLTGIIRTLDDLRERGILVRSLREGIDTSTPTGRMVAGIFASLSEYERTLMLERASAARAAALARGQRAGRKPVLTDDQVALARRMRKSGESIHALRAAFPQAGKSTLYRLVQTEGAVATSACASSAPFSRRLT